MHRMRGVTLERVEHLMRDLREARFDGAVPLTLTAAHIGGEPVPYVEAVQLPHEPTAVGELWGTTWGTTWFHATGRVPDEWRDRADGAVVVRFDLGIDAHPGFGGEALVYQDGLATQGISPVHDVYPLDETGGLVDVDLRLEAGANPFITGDGPRVRGSWPLHLPDPDGPRLFRIRRAELSVLLHEVDALATDLFVVHGMAKNLSEESQRGAECLRALEASVLALDLDDVTGSAGAARRPLIDVLASPTGSNVHKVTTAGHAHIDTAWLWPVREARRKVARTFASAERMMSQYPEYRFVSSAALHWDWVRTDHPELFDRIKGRVAEGRFEAVGSMWVEADCNVPSGESLARQLVHGRRWFADTLGVDVRGLWLPDVFGYAGNLPQLIRRSGGEWFLTQKLSWNEQNRFPHSTFWWEGIDGSRVLTHFPPADTYGGTFDVAALVKGVRQFREHGTSDRSLYLYGYGDGGGGPTRELIERARRVADTDGLPKVEQGSVNDFFDELLADDRADELPVWVGELYFECHRGTYTSQARTKQSNRRLELALREAETWSAMADVLGGPTYPAAELDAAWKLLMVDQFHDILPGTSIHWVYEDVARHHAEVGAAADAAVDAALGDLDKRLPTAGAQRPVAIWNPAGHARRDVWTIDDVAVVVDVPACGWTVIDLDAAQADLFYAVTVDAEARTMGNKALRMSWDDNGRITSLVHEATGRESLAAPGNVLQSFDDRPNRYDAWDIDHLDLRRPCEVGGDVTVEVVETGPAVGAVRVVRTFGESTITQTIRLHAGSDTVMFDTEVDWHESHTMLKVAFPLDVRSETATYEVQYGHLSRPTHTNTTWDLARYEVCAQRWADLSEPGFGVALLNDGRFGHDCRGQVLRMTLLRSPGAPDPECDRGRHSFTYALMPHAGTLQQAGVIERALELNLPVRIRPLAAGQEGSLPATGSFVAVGHPSAAVSAVKKADDGDGLVVRMYESFGGRGTAALSVFPDLRVTSASSCDLLEVAEAALPVADDGAVSISLTPFEVATVRLEVAPT